jgi:thioredoxin 1
VNWVSRMDELERIKQKRLREMMRKVGSRANDSTDGWPTMPVELADATFNEVISKYPLVVVDCWAEWCAPCRMVGPVVEELARDYRGRIVFGKLNVDSNVMTAQQYGIMSIPTLLVFKNGQLANQLVGAMPRYMLEPQITMYL